MPSAPAACRAAFAVALLSCAALPLRAAFFNITNTAGTDYVHSAPEVLTAWSLGSAAAVDLDGDGWTDLVVGRSEQPCLVFVNQRNNTFVEQAAARGLAGVSGVGGIGTADFDNDGDADLFFAPRDGSRFFLFINDGSGRFTEQAVARGADVTSALQMHRGHSVNVGDYDRDGWLDIYVSEYDVPSSAENALHSVLLRNRGASAPGSFENRTVAAGLLQPRTTSLQSGFASAWADFDEDGWPDLSLIVDVQKSQFYWNNGNGTFLEGGKAAGVTREENGMGVAVADYDGDGRLDYFVTSIFEPETYKRLGSYQGNKLYRALGGRQFDERAVAAGVGQTAWGWGAAFFDADNDADPDLVINHGVSLIAPNDPRIPYTGPVNEPTRLFRNDGNGQFTMLNTGASGISHANEGRAVVVWDMDNDGDLDLFVTDAYGHPSTYRNDASTNGNRWIRLKLRGTDSNRDGIGAVVRLTIGGKTQTQLYNPSNAFLAQHEPYLHFGVGTATGTASVQILWPNGGVQNVTGVATNELRTITEPVSTPVVPAITTAPVGGTFAKDAAVTLTAAASGNPAPVYVWAKDGVAIAGATGATLSIPRVHPFDAGSYTVTAINPAGSVTSAPAAVNVSVDLSLHSTARWWNEALLDAIRKDVPNPPVHARNLYHLSAALWDSFWAYQPEGWSRATPVFVRENVSPSDWTGGREAAQRTAMCYAAYRILTKRFLNSAGKVRTAFGNRWFMQQFGLDPDFTGTAGNSPAAVGNRIGYGVLDATLLDGANEAGGYADQTGFVRANPPLIFQLLGTEMDDPNRWQPLAFDYAVTQTGIPLGALIQGFVGVNARNTTPFALVKPTPTTLAIDPGPPPRLGGATDAEFKRQAVEIIRYSAQLDANDTTTIDISPGALLNNPLGTNAGTGRALNPVTGKPYAANVVRRADYGRVLAEYWADGPNSETPPGHWNVVFNQVTDHPLTTRRYAGTGDVLPQLEWDVRGYLALNGAVHDAACTAWLIKRQYDGARPISMIRYMGGKGQSSDPAGPSYHVQGLPLEAGLVEVITTASSAAGQRHAHLAAHVGKIAIRAWPGQPADPRSQVGGASWILAGNWMPFQMRTFVTPAFPGYVSGHSTFSRAAAEVLALYTGSPFFPGGLGEYSFAAGKYLSFEYGPAADVKLQWATYYDAADQAGVSRLFGGIHVSADDFTGRRLGAQAGLGAFLKAQAMRDAAVPPRGIIGLSTRARAGAGDEVLIAGFAIEGAADRSMLVRCVGPELAKYGVANCDADPNLTLHRASDNSVVLTNDNWGASPRAATIETQAAARGTFALTAGGKDAAELATLSPGTYTVVARSAAPAARGIELAEVYGDNLVAISTRGSVGAGEAVMTGGFGLVGTEPMAVLVRGIGPTLAGYGVSGTLKDPVVEVYRIGAGGVPSLVARNDNWSDDPRASLAIVGAVKSGDFPLDAGSKDAALLLQLPPGTYTAQVGSADGTTGVALVEVYLVK